MSDHYYVYIHHDRGQLLYVGKGMAGRAWDWKTRRAPHKEWLKRLSASGMTSNVSIVAAQLAEHASYELEAALIYGYRPTWNVVKPDHDVEYRRSPEYETYADLVARYVWPEKQHELFESEE